MTGYDSQYNSESAFVDINPGQTRNFQVFFINAGTTTWTRGTSTQVDLAACLEDKVSCNVQDAREASWNTNWLSTTRYATTSNTSVAPGGVGTFSYNITAPVGATNGIYRFNGDLVLSTTGEKIHPEGYYQEANLGGVATGTATITDLDPNEGTTAGDDNVVITGTGIVCTPAFPSVSFGGTAAAVVSCGSTSLTVTSPAHAAGNVAVTVTNSGQGPSNSLTFEYQDLDEPVFTSMAVSGDLLTVTFSEGVCTDTAYSPADWNVTNISNPSGDLAGATSGANIPDCADDETVTSFVITLASAVPPGALVEATLNESTTGGGENVNYEDASGNFANAPQARQATATAPETVQPDLISASGNVGSTTITLTFSEPIWCDAGFTPATEITVVNLDGTDPAVVSYGSDPCTTDRAAAETTFNITISDDIESDSEYEVTIDADTEVQDAAGNNLDDNEASFTAGAGDFTPPTIVDARVAANVGTTDFTETDDAFTLTFSEVMDADATGDTIQIQDQDGTVFTLACGGAPATTNSVTCDWNTAETAVTVTLDEAITPPPVGSAGAGDTPGMQIPFNVTTLTGFADAQGNVPNVLGSSDRLVDYE
ncbi:MAG: IPT/TIG domain-containing protein [Chloroflexota bacterium]